MTPVRGCATSNPVGWSTESDVPPVVGWGLWPTFRHTESIKETSEMAWNDDKEPEVTPPGPSDVERITYDAVCTCCDTYGDDPWCPACYPSRADQGTA